MSEANEGGQAVNDNEAPNVMYGRLLEAAHIIGYTFERAMGELEWLLEGARWQTVGGGYQDVNDFIRSIKLDLINTNIEQRKKLHQRIRELQPNASTHAIAAMTGVSQPTVYRDLKPDSNESSDAQQGSEIERDHTLVDSSELPTPLAQSGREAAQALEKAAEQARRREEKEREQEKQRQLNQQLVEQTAPLAELPGVFRTIVIDPPWDWDDEGDVSQFGRGRHEYAAMSFDELLAFPVSEKADGDCHLYLWITNRSLPKGFALMEAWGFRYVTCLTWVKPSIGMGNYFRGSTEHVLFGIKGSLPLLRKDVGTHFDAERPGQHSAKPDAFYRLVESCSPGPWLELFCRGEPYPGWWAWGAEA